MEAELVQVAREAGGALRQPHWAEMAARGIGFGQVLVILGGLWLMNKAANIRNRQLDIMEANQERQGEMMTEALQGLRQQGEVLGELLRRSTPA